ncbi:hypothetical protein PP459_gp086 [Streptomyces phage Wakanda]|uniref:Uncharacterized protein n=2 Tax=Wakandavirus TaxID=3044854 RepID=A0A6G8R3F5_9CAUD|nr:hypothetical protein PP459_gp086 [Streptomyces phage Wakanda]YP_010652467.1 hypothetical protein PP460_gp091 [Streptomyces phage Muntaha]QIN94147.1 hypothetical protein SEA_WAKANDA_186 [Streptomyces phage Wakanda]QIN94711.1 hypothetical protein SEA_MUNTAHA_187 [Streptomyces phage Muntaha]
MQPEDFYDIQVRENDAIGPISTWRVVGLTLRLVKNPDYYGSSFIHEEVENLIHDDFSSKPLAKAWMRAYLDRHVRDRYFSDYVDC